MKSKDTEHQKREKLNIWVSPEERKRLELHLFAERKSMVDWAREKISELPKYEIKKQRAN